MDAVPYSRGNPSPRYRELVSLYRAMHASGDAEHGLAPEQTFAGFSLARQIDGVKAMVERYGAESLLDYGCGKGRLYFAGRIAFPDGSVIEGLQRHWGVKRVTLYDPGYPRFAALPEGSFDGVVCTDVLEHCPEEDLPWIVEELFGFARRFVFANVACFPAKKRLPNGENAHATVRDAAWWRALIAPIAERHRGIACRFLFEEPEAVSAFETEA